MTAFLEEFKQAADGQRHDVVMNLVRKILEDILGAQKLTALTPEAELKSLGVGSLQALEVRKRLGTELASTLPATLFMETPTLDSLVTYVENRAKKSL